MKKGTELGSWWDLARVIVIVLMWQVFGFWVGLITAILIYGWMWLRNK